MRKRRARAASKLTILATAFLASWFVGCDDGVPQYVDTSASPVVSATAPPSAASAEKRGPDRLGSRKRANKGDAPVYVDGELVAVLRYGELPPNFSPTTVNRRGEFTMCNVARYLEAIGVDVSKIKALHLEGSGRIAAIDGDEFRRHKDTLHFTFSKLRGTYGKALMDWPDKKVVSTTRIDKVAAVYVFEDKVAPTWSRDKRAFFWEDGSKVEGRPYVEGGSRRKIKSARIYVDGKLLGFIDDLGELPKDVWKTGDGRGTGKTTDAASEEKEDDKPLSPDERGGVGGGKKVVLAKYLAHRGVDLSAIKTVELIGEDRVLARYDQEEWKKQIDEVAFGVPKRNKKRLRLEVDEPASPYPGPVSAQAIAVYIQVKPRDREITLPRRRPRRK